MSIVAFDNCRILDGCGGLRPGGRIAANLAIIMKAGEFARRAEI